MIFRKKKQKTNKTLHQDHRSKTMDGIPLNYYVRTIFQSDKYQNTLIIIALIYRTKMER